MTATGCGWDRMNGKVGLDGGLDSWTVLGIRLDGWVERNERDRARMTRNVSVG